MSYVDFFKESQITKGWVQDLPETTPGAPEPSAPAPEAKPYLPKPGRSNLKEEMTPRITAATRAEARAPGILNLEQPRPAMPETRAPKVSVAAGPLIKPPNSEWHLITKGISAAEAEWARHLSPSTGKAGSAEPEWRLITKEVRHASPVTTKDWALLCVTGFILSNVATQGAASLAGGFITGLCVTRNIGILLTPEPPVGGRSPPEPLTAPPHLDPMGPR